MAYKSVRLRLLSFLLASGLLLACARPSMAGDGVKPVMHGLVDMSDISFYGFGGEPTFIPDDVAPYADSFSGIVLNTTWAALQPDGPGALARNNPIDQAIQALTTYNSQHPKSPLTMKLRVYGGFTAPMWAQRIGGSPISISPQEQGRTGTVGRWWTRAYIRKWRALQVKLAKKYDGNPLISQVAITSCASTSDEPFVPFDLSGIQELQGGGYTDAAQRSCMLGAIGDYAPWKRTYIDFTFNPFHNFDSGHDVNDPNFTTRVMKLCENAPHCILDNHTLNDPLRASNDSVYNEMRTLYAKNPKHTVVNFQTAKPCELPWCGTIANASMLHASSVEVWPTSVNGGGFNSFTPDVVANMANALLNGTAPAASPCPPPPPGNCPTEGD